MSQTAKSSNDGCFKAFGMGCLVVILLGVAGSILAYRAAKNWFIRHTDSAPVALPQLTASQKQVDDTLERVGAFAGAIRNGKPAEPLTLTADDINILISRHPGWQATAGKVWVTISGNELRGVVSIPLDDLGKVGKGRYLNGSASFTVGMMANQLVIFLTSVEVKGKPLPEQIMQGLRAKNMAEDANNQPATREVLSRLESIAIRDNQLQIVPRLR